MKINYFLILILFPSFLIAQTESTILNIDATIPYQGVGESIPLLGSAKYKVFYSGNSAVIDKPIVFVDGFDPNDSRDITSMYELLNYGNPVENLGDIVRSEGFDLIVLNFPEEYLSPTDGTSTIKGGADFIQRNAFILVELLNVINDLKVGPEENVIIGPSMGGLISQYALRYMEENSMDHETRLFISFDTPHLGANVPIGLQYLFNYMVNGDPGITEVEPLVNGLLNSPAAKQMLIDHYLGHVDAGGIEQDGSTHTPKGAPNYRDAFQTELINKGLPQNTRNIAISNGSGNGQTTGTPGMELINRTFDTGLVNVPIFGDVPSRAIISVNFTPLKNQNITVTDFVGQANIIGWNTIYSFNATGESTSSSDGIDSAPGGLFDLDSFDDGSNALITEFVDNLNTQYFDFIPTLSGLSISDSDWYTIPIAANSPFDDVFIPINNEPHVTITEANANFALAEIRQGALSILDFNTINIKLAQNPVSNELNILSDETLPNTKITIVDITGKNVYNETITLENKTTIPLQLASGMYIINLRAKDNSNKQFKLLVSH